MSVGEHSNIGRIFFAVEFLLMMTLDVTPGVRKLCTGKKSRPGNSKLCYKSGIPCHQIADASRKKANYGPAYSGCYKKNRCDMCLFYMVMN